MNQTQERLIELLRPSLAEAVSDLRLPDWTEEEWEAVVTEADRHRSVPLLCRRLVSRFPTERVPAPARDRLQRGYRTSAVKNLRRFHSLAPVLNGFSQAGIQVIVLKGAYLASTVYENFALRQMSDVDLLLRREDLAAADSILASSGFRRREFDLAPAREENEFHYRGPAGGGMIEIHWELYKPDYPFRFDLEAMRLAAVPAMVAGVEVLVFSPEDQLVHLASHAAIHRFEFGLRSLCDLAEVIARNTIDWPLLVEKANRWRTGRAVGISLALVREWFRAEVPAEAIAGLGTADLPKALLSEARETVLLNRQKNRGHGEPNPNLLLFMGRKSWRDRLTLVRNRFFPSRQTVAAMFPVAADSLRVWLYYPRYGWMIISRNLPGLRIFMGRKVRRNAERDASAELMDWLLK